MTWLILAPERGVLRREPTHTRAVAWLLGLDDATLVLGEGRVPTRLREGLHELYATIVGGGGVLRIEGLDDGVAVCVDEVLVGTAEPRP